ncbi:MAG: 4Fe-4S cluster-binding domain-containing protein [Acutalibacteraceae bacterium]|nr:4Fe-4S cluster-binding domain-containing protein [Acutalibacteraceae bacterium]
MIKFNVAAINCCTETEGPYKRLTIWFQGCDIHCKECCNPDYQAFVVRNLMTLDDEDKQIDFEQYFGLKV